MPTHVRRQLREAAATAVTGLTTTGSRVFQSRMRPQADAGLPCLLVATNDEAVSPGSVGAMQERELTLTVTGVAKASADVDDTLDAMALEVETALAAAHTLGGLAAGMELRGLKVEFDDETDKPVGQISLDYRLTYFVSSGSPGFIV